MAKRQNEAPLSPEEKREALRTLFSTRGWKEVLRPALEDVIDGTTKQWMGNMRIKGEENLPDEALKQRAAALTWVLSWERKYKELVNQLEELQKQREPAEPPAAGGSPY